jgi:hypothetical protein
MVGRRRVPDSGVGVRRHPGPSVWFRAGSLARPCGPVALIVVKLCKSGLSKLSEGTGIAAERLGSLLPPKILSHRRRPVPMTEMGPGLSHGTSPWADGPREDAGGDAALNHLNASEYYQPMPSGVRTDLLKWTREPPFEGLFAVARALREALRRPGADCGRRAARRAGRPRSPGAPQRCRSRKSARRSRRRSCSSPRVSAASNGVARRSSSGIAKVRKASICQSGGPITGVSVPHRM